MSLFATDLRPRFTLGCSDDHDPLPPRLPFLMDRYLPGQTNIWLRVPLMTPYSLAYIPSPRTSPDLMASGGGGGQQICVIACLSINPVSHCIVCTDKCFWRSTSPGQHVIISYRGWHLERLPVFQVKSSQEQLGWGWTWHTVPLL